jgi:hypothetical protein
VIDNVSVKQDTTYNPVSVQKAIYNAVAKKKAIEEVYPTKAIDEVSQEATNKKLFEAVNNLDDLMF